MELETSLWIMAAGALMFIIGNVRARRPYVPGKLPLIPNMALQFVGMLIVLVMVGHLISLLSGKPFTGRNPY